MNNNAASLPLKILAWILIVFFTAAFAIGCVTTAWLIYSDCYISSLDEVVELVDSRYIFYSENSRDFGMDAVRLLYNNRYAIPSISILLLLGVIVSFCYLMWAAGRRRGVDGFTLNIFDRIPFDLYLLCIGGLFTLVASILDDLMWGTYDYSAQIILTVAFVLVLSTLFYAACMSFAARVKLRAVVSGSLTYKILRLSWKALVWLWKHFCMIIAGASAMWVVLIVFAVYTILSAVVRDSFLFWLLLQLATAALLCLVGLNMDKLSKAGKRLANGDLQHKIDTTQLYLAFKAHGEHLNSISQGMTAAVDERLKSERFKTELITNVSHDIRTPLTSIVNYTDLLSKEELPPAAREYVDVLIRQSQRLRKLTEDVLEASKASSGAIKPDLLPTDITELIAQCGAEYAQRFDNAGLIPVTNIPCQPVIVNADGKLLWRILDNLLSNACKYSLPGTRVYLEAASANGNAVISVRNISQQPLNISADELMERFVRGDSSRNTDGSGLGLSIAQSFAQLMHASLSLSIDGDLFKASLSFPLA